MSGEQCIPVRPLPVPDLARLPPLDVLARNPAVALFVRQAAARQPAFALTADNAARSPEICARLDGLPLAIELAAARIRILSPAQMLARLERRLALLTGGGRDLPVRQQTLRQAIDWSHELLTDAEKRLFRRLAVFAGSWTLEAAEAVCNPRQDPGLSVLDGMSSLVDKSLIQEVDAAPDELRFAMLETVREYALEQLDASGEHPVTRRAHAAYCLVLAEEGLGPIAAAQRDEWLARCQREHDNHRAAFDHLIAHARRRLGAAPGARARPTTGIGTTIASKALPASRRCCGCRGWRRGPRPGPPPSPSAACSRRCSRRRRPSRKRCRSTASSATCAAWSGS